MKGAATENSRRRQDNEALAPPALLDDRGKVIVEPENQAVGRDKQALAKILSGLPELSKASLTTVITTAQALLKPPALAVIEERRSMYPRAPGKPTDPNAKKAKDRKDKDREGPKPLSDEEKKTISTWGRYQEVVAAQTEIFSGRLKKEKDLLRSTTQAGYEEMEEGPLKESIHRVASLRSLSFALKAFAREHYALLKKGKEGVKELDALWEKEDKPLPFFPKPKVKANAKAKANPSGKGDDVGPDKADKPKDAKVRAADDEFSESEASKRLKTGTSPMELDTAKENVEELPSIGENTDEEMEQLDEGEAENLMPSKLSTKKEREAKAKEDPALKGKGKVAK